jgi:hypothetical protein
VKHKILPIFFLCFLLVFITPAYAFSFEDVASWFSNFFRITGYQAYVNETTTTLLSCPYECCTDPSYEKKACEYPKICDGYKCIENITGTCTNYYDQICPYTCYIGSDADCCKNSGKYWLETPSGYGCYYTNYNTGCSPKQPCSEASDGCCPNWCAPSSDYDCCYQAGRCYINGACLDCSQTNVTCSDSDGQNYYSKGTCNDAQGTKTDVCIVGGMRNGYLEEYGCFNNQCLTEERNCNPQGCSNGACLCTGVMCADGTMQTCVLDKEKGSCVCTSCPVTKPPTTACQSTAVCRDGTTPICKLVDNVCTCTICSTISQCTDSDQGINYDTKGYIKLATGTTNEDSCGSDGYLYEYYCADGEIRIEKHICTYGCKDGACASEVDATAQACTDSDGTYIASVENGIYHPPGEDRYVKGTVTYGSAVYEDSCSNLVYFTDSLGNTGGKFEKSYEGKGVIEIGCLDGKTPYETAYFECPKGCKDGACTRQQISEQVTCMFRNSNKEQECFIADSSTQTVEGVKSCKGKDSCVMNVTGFEGNQVLWKSTCGHTATTMDGKNKNAEFECKGGETNITEIKNKGFRYAYWQCYDGAENKSSEREDCKTAEHWKKIASIFCSNHCKTYNDVEKCGVNSFSISNECYIEEIPTYAITSIPSIATPIPTSALPATTGEGKATTQENTTTLENFLICKDSCPSEGKCYPFGYRKEGKFCSDDGAFKDQLKENSVCENNFECSTNVCVDGKCISSGLIQKIMNFFKNLFGLV